MSASPAAAPNIGELLLAARTAARAVAGAGAAGSSVTGREALLLIARLLGASEATVLAHPERGLDDHRHRRFAALWQRRLAGEPMAYLLGEREFYGRPFAVDRRVLIPRPETEHLVERALRLDLPADARLLDVATGSGAIAVTLACERPGWRVTASDRSSAALAVADRNRRALGVGHRVTLVCGDWLRALRAASFDAVTCNPPYLSHRERASLSLEVARWEPAGALFAGDDGLAAYRLLLAPDSPLGRGVPLVLEIGDRQLAAVLALAERGGFALLSVDRDLRGTDRVVTLARSA